MNKEELLEVKKYLGANLINTIFLNPDDISYEELMVWNDLSYDKKWDHIPDNLYFTGGTILDIDPICVLTVEKIFSTIT